MLNIYLKHVFYKFNALLYLYFYITIIINYKYNKFILFILFSYYFFLFFISHNPFLTNLCTASLFI